MSVVAVGPVLLDALEVLGPLSAARRWPDRMPTPGTRRAAQVLTLAGVVAPFLDHGLGRPWLRRWGAAPAERARRLPGDPGTRALFTTTRAVTVHAPAEAVWRWLVQIGQDRGGFYSYDWLENLAGCNLHSAEEIHEEWQERHPGDPLTLFDGYSTPLLQVEPSRALVIQNWGAYVLEPIDSDSCRLLARSRAERNAMGIAYILGIELPHAIMERKMLLGIKQRAEREFDARRAAGVGTSPSSPGTAPPALLEVHLEELGEHSWLKALANTLTGSFGSAQFRFVARPPGRHHDEAGHVVTGATFPVMRLQDLDDLHEPNAWIDDARERLEDLDTELRGRGWQRAEPDGVHWWSRTYRAPDSSSTPGPSAS
jgi:hypothetical protein